MFLLFSSWLYGLSTIFVLLFSFLGFSLYRFFFFCLFVACILDFWISGFVLAFFFFYLPAFRCLVFASLFNISNYFLVIFVEHLLSLSQV